MLSEEEESVDCNDLRQYTCTHNQDHSAIFPKSFQEIKCVRLRHILILQRKISEREEGWKMITVYRAVDGICSRKRVEVRECDRL